MLQGDSDMLKGLASLRVYRHAHTHMLDMTIGDSIQAPPPSQTVPLPCAVTSESSNSY